MKDSDNTLNDIEFTRQILYLILQKGEAALEEMESVAESTQHPRSYEVYSNMMKNMAEVSDRLLDLHKKKKEILSDQQQEKDGQNHIPITADDLQRLINKNE